MQAIRSMKDEKIGGGIDEMPNEVCIMEKRN